MDEAKDSIDGNDKKSYESNADGSQAPRRDLEKQEPSERLPTDDDQRRKSKYDTGDPFGDEEDSEVKYKTMSWWQAAMVMIAETISLGILSLPSVLASIGLVPGIILIIALGIIATYTGYTIYQFKMAYPHVHNLGDVGEVLLGRIGREVFGAAQTIFLIFTMGSSTLR